MTLLHFTEVVNQARVNIANSKLNTRLILSRLNRLSKGHFRGMAWLPFQKLFETVGYCSYYVSTQGQRTF